MNKKSAKRKTTGLVIMCILSFSLMAASIWTAWQTMNTLPDSAATQVSVSVSPSDTTTTHDPEEDVFWTGLQKGTIVSDNTPLLDSPSDDGESIYSAAKGDPAVVIRREGRWMQTRVYDRTGWVDIDSLTLEGEPEEYSSQVDDVAVQSLADTDIQSSLDNISAGYGCVGVTAAVIKNGEVAYTYEYGYANRKSKTPMTADTKIRIASVSKIAVGMTALAMTEQGLITLDDDVSDHLGFTVRNPRYKGTDITFNSLLTHTSSIKEVNLDGNDPSSLETKLSKKSSYSGDRPGKANSFSYCNAGINTAAAALEMASGTTLVDYTDRYFFQSLGVDASFLAANIASPELIATLYDSSGIKQSVKDLLSRPYYETPGDNFTIYAGGLTISAQDMARMLCILINNGTYHNVYYLSPQSVEAMEERIYNIAEYDQCLVLKYREDHLDGRDLYYHTGNAYGVLSYASYDPATGDGIVVITTGSDTQDKSKGVYLPCKKIAELIYSDLL